MHRIRLAITLLIFAAMVYTGYKIVPVMWANMQFRQAIEEQARQSCYTKDTPQEIQSLVLRQAHQLELPVQPDDITAERIAGGVSIKVDYTVPIDLLVRTVELKFSPSATTFRPY